MAKAEGGGVRQQMVWVRQHQQCPYLTLLLLTTRPAGAVQGGAACRLLLEGGQGRGLASGQVNRGPGPTSPEALSLSHRHFQNRPNDHYAKPNPGA